MAAKSEAIPSERGDRLRVVLVELKPGENLGAHARNGVFVEARLGEGEPHQIEHLVLVGGQRLQIAEHHVAPGVEVHAHGEALSLLLEGQRVEIAGALVHHRRNEISEPLLARIVLGGAAAKGEAHGDQRIGVAFDEPGLDPAGTRDALNLHVISLGCLGGGEDEESGGEPHEPGSKRRSGTGHG